ncbi:hypothetical protein BD779DRAFT_1560069 [Infundibulicybe gibba]|nr:hypothetical protein BD779DRAFT_1560069 [Infundibulicybe gibba]
MGSKPSKPNGLDSKLVQSILITYLPPEQVDEILGDAMGKPKIHASKHNLKPTKLSADNRDHNDVSQCCLVTSPLLGSRGGEGSGIKVRMVRFGVRSHGRGQPSRGPGYDSACTWFEAIILRPNQPEPSEGVRSNKMVDSFLEHTEKESVLPPSEKIEEFGFTYGASPLGGDSAKWMLQRNSIASDTPMDHEIIWTKGGAFGDAGSGGGSGFIAALQEHDRVAVIARAQVCAGSGDSSGSVAALQEGDKVAVARAQNYVKSIWVDIYYD